ncbi:porin [Noviherbaspirillum saxi]|uniref:Porin n=1 Tax=Noviherbaspirillum saxi TaxID=2320863 RepID=A0A3A3FLS1_9BURK|nr:porin [Noviherbaspirillum saxi]RJF97177.1 porin [Noviherbaspirillum saxi]
MKKSLIALAALSSLTGAAFAQTNVTIYGVADAGISRIDNGATNSTALSSGNQSGSRIGFRGTEDLGGGLSAIFTLENGFNIDDGTLGQGGRLFGRQAFVGLNGGFGSVKLGRQYNPIRTAVENIDPFGLGLAGNAANVFNVHGERADNTLSYATPNFGGFSGQVNYSFGEVAGSNSIGRQVGFSAGYAAGPLAIVLAHHDQNLVGTGAAATIAAGDSKTTMLGGTYDFKIAKLHAAYARGKGETATGATSIDRDDAMVGISAPIGAGIILASYIRRNDDIGGGTRDADQWALGYTHALSKRTNLYTSYARIKNDAAATVGNPVAAGRDPSIFNVGVRHRF